MSSFRCRQDLKVQTCCFAVLKTCFVWNGEGSSDPNVIRNFCFSVFFSRCIWLISSDFQRSAEITLVLTLLVSNVVSCSGSNSFQVHKDSNNVPETCVCQNAQNLWLELIPESLATLTEPSGNSADLLLYLCAGFKIYSGLLKLVRQLIGKKQSFWQSAHSKEYNRRILGKLPSLGSSCFAVSSSAFSQASGISRCWCLSSAFFRVPVIMTDSSVSVFLFVSIAKQDYPAIRVLTWDLGRPSFCSLLHHILPVLLQPSRTSEEVEPENADGCLALLWNLRTHFWSLQPLPPAFLCILFVFLSFSVSALLFFFCFFLHFSCKAAVRALLDSH